MADGEKPGKTGVGSLGISLGSWMMIFSSWSRFLSSWTLVDSPSAFRWRMRRADSVCRLGDEPVGLQWSLPKLWRSRCATSANPAVSCEGGRSSVSSQTGAGAVELSVAAAAGERVNIADDGAFTVAAGPACWMVRILLLLLLYLGDRPTSDCFRAAVWLAMLPAQPPSLAGGEATAPYREGKAWTVRIGTCEGSDTWANWLLTAVTDG